MSIENSNAYWRKLESREDRRRELTWCNESLPYFVGESWKLIEPSTPLVTGRYFDCLCDYLTAVTAGEIRRLIINIQPRVGKSSLVSVLWPCWEWARDSASSRWIFASYAEDLSIRDSVRRRNVIQSEWYQERWGDRVKLAPDVNLKDEYVSTHAGCMYSTWVGGGTGRGGKRLVVDDPHSPKKALSDAERQTGVAYIRSVLMSRLDNPATDSVVIIAQRLHENDVCGEFLADGGWYHLDLQSEAEERTVVPWAHSGEPWVREQGDLLVPERFPRETLEDIKREMGSIMFSAQYQQRPAPKSGILFQPSWWRYWDTLPQLESIVISVDAAFKSTPSSDYVAVHVYGFQGARTFLLDRVTEHLGYAATKQVIRSMLARWRASHVLIEQSANGIAVCEELSSEFPGIVPIKPEGGKIARAQAATADAESGNIFLPQSAPYTLPLIQTFSKFPNDKHDDDVDALSQCINWRRQRVDYSMFDASVDVFMGGHLRP